MSLQLHGLTDQSTDHGQSQTTRRYEKIEQQTPESVGSSHNVKRLSLDIEKMAAELHEHGKCAAASLACHTGIDCACDFHISCEDDSGPPNLEGLDACLCDRLPICVNNILPAKAVGALRSPPETGTTTITDSESQSTSTLILWDLKGTIETFHPTRDEKGLPILVTKLNDNADSTRTLSFVPKSSSHVSPKIKAVSAIATPFMSASDHHDMAFSPDILAGLERFNRHTMADLRTMYPDLD